MFNRIWRRSLLVSCVATLAVFGYTVLYYGEVSLVLLQEVFAVAAVLVIAPSLALSGVAYFWDFADKWIVYRKSLGLLGFYLGLLHVGISIYRTGFVLEALRLESWYSVAVVSGYLAVFLFGLMPVFSNPLTIRRLGGAAVRLALRYLGYAAYILVLLHAVILFWDDWMYWSAVEMSFMVPPTLLATVVGVAVILLRVVLFFAKLFEKPKET